MLDDRDSFSSLSEICKQFQYVTHELSTVRSFAEILFKIILWAMWNYFKITTRIELLSI